MLRLITKDCITKINTLNTLKRFSSNTFKSIHIKINANEYEVAENSSILDVCKQHNIELPSLFSKDIQSAPNKYDISKVEISGMKDLQSSINTKVSEGMEIWTNTPKIKEYQYKNIKTMYSEVVDKSVFNTPEMNKLLECTSESNGTISMNYMKCINCDSCIATCQSIQKTSVFSSSNSSLPIEYTNGINLNTSNCIHCGQCANTCPTHAIETVSHVSRVQNALKNYKYIIFEIDPSIKSLLSEHNYKTQNDLISEIKSYNIPYIFDTQVAYDVYISTFTDELYNKITGQIKYPQTKGKKSFPLITSTCPSTIELIKQNYPDLIPFISTCSNPSEMIGQNIKTQWASSNHIDPKDIYIVNLTSCSSMKHNIQSNSSIDAVINLNEWKQLKSNIQLPSQHVESSQISMSFDKPYNTSSATISQSITTGGLLENIIKQLMIKCKNTNIPEHIENCQNIKSKKMFIQKITDNNNKETKKDFKLRCVAVNSNNIEPLMDKIMKGSVQYDLIEVFACSEGCIQSTYLADNVTQTRKNLVLEKQKNTFSYPSENPLLSSFNNQLYTKQLQEQISKETQDFINYVRSSSISKIDPSQLNKDILILYGTQGGTSLQAAKQIQTQLNENKIENRLVSMENASASDLLKESRVILVCCTYGQGEFPQSAKKFWSSLNDKKNNSKLFEHLEYGIFGLGSSQYKKFNEAGRLLDEQLSLLGGKRLLERGKADDTKPGKYNTELEHWFPDYMKSIHKDIILYKDIDPLYNIASSMKDKYLRIQPPHGYTYVPLTQVTTETAPNYDREIRLFHFNLNNTGLSYNTGDHAAIYPRNNKQLINKILNNIEYDGTNQIFIQPIKQNQTTDFPNTLSVSELFEQYYDMNTSVTKQFLKQIYNYIDNNNEKQFINDIVMNKDNYDLYSSCTTIGDCLLSLSSLHMPLSHMISILPPIKPRLYSIASSSRMYPKDLQLAIGLNAFNTPSEYHPIKSTTTETQSTSENISTNDKKTMNTKLRRGLTTGYLWDLDPKEQPKVAMSIHKGLLYLPEDLITPTLFLSLGTGVAPFRGFLQEREALYNEGKKLGPCTYYYGCRYEQKDFVFGDYIKSLVSKGVIDNLQCAFSRPNHYHIDQVMKENPDIAYQAINHDNLHSYYCGIAKGVPDSIMDALVNIYNEKSEKSEKEKIMKQQELEKNYHLECF